MVIYIYIYIYVCITLPKISTHTSYNVNHIWNIIVTTILSYINTKINFLKINTKIYIKICKLFVYLGDEFQI